MKFGFDWPRGFRVNDVDKDDDDVGRRSMGILQAHLVSLKV